jgi:hypothetical protein
MIPLARAIDEYTPLGTIVPEPISPSISRRTTAATSMPRWEGEHAAAWDANFDCAARPQPREYAHLVVRIDDVGGRDTAGSAAAAAASCRKTRRGSFIFEPPSCFTSLDYLVGAGEQCGWHVEAKRPRCLEVDHQLVLARRLHRQVGRPLALEYAIDIRSRTSP